jgi:hypothetical protein
MNETTVSILLAIFNQGNKNHFVVTQHVELLSKVKGGLEKQK